MAERSIATGSVSVDLSEVELVRMMSSAPCAHCKGVKLSRVGFSYKWKCPKCGFACEWFPELPRITRLTERGDL